MDELQVPGGWQLADTVETEPGGANDCSQLFPGCPKVARYYLVEDQPLQAYARAKEMVSAAEFGVAEEFDPQCDGRPSAPLCALFAEKNSDLIRISVYGPGQDPDGRGIARDDRLMVRIVAQAK